MEDIIVASAAQLAKAIRERQISSQEVVDAYLMLQQFTTALHPFVPKTAAEVGSLLTSWDGWRIPGAL